jgi:hypothetical protein
MEMRQTIECLLAGQEEMKTKADADREQMLARMQEKMEDKTKAMRENVKSGQSGNELHSWSH